MDLLDPVCAPFVAKITGKTYTSGVWYYDWEEYQGQYNAVSRVQASPGRQGSDTVSPAFEINNTEVDVDTFVLMYGRGFVNGQFCYEFAAPDTSASALSSITGATWDGASATTIDASMSTLRVDTRDGLSLANVSAGVDLLTIADATASQAGIVSTGTQTFAGAKTLTGNLILSAGTLYFDSAVQQGMKWEDSGNNERLNLTGYADSGASAGLHSQVIGVTPYAATLGELSWFQFGSGAIFRTVHNIYGTADYAQFQISSAGLSYVVTDDSVILQLDTNGLTVGTAGDTCYFGINGETGKTHTSAFGGVYTGGILTTAPSAYNLDDLSNVTVPTPSSGDVLQWNGSAWVNTPGSGLGSGGTVTSVALTAPSILSVGGSPVTTSGTLALTLATQVANRVFAGPSSGADATPTFRALVTDDLANDIVTYAKLQNVSATSRILGRKTAAAGDTEECTLSEVLDFVGSAAQGDILYRGAATWTRLGAGTAGYVLQTGGAGANPSWVITREVLTAARTYYVRTDGSDSNNGLANTAGGAFLTVQKAVDVITGTLDTAGYAVTISVGSGTFTNAITLKHIVGGGTVSIVGAGLASTTFSVTSAVCITGDGCGGGWAVTDVKMQTTTSGSCISMTQGYLTFANVAFGTTVNYHIFTGVGGFVKATGNYTINGNAQIHWFAAGSGSGITVQSVTVTLTGTPAFSLEFARARDVSSIVCNGITFSGSGTGTRYNALGNGVIDTNGSASTYLPGNAAGSTSSGGQYI